MRHTTRLLLVPLLFITSGIVMATEEPVFEEQIVDRIFSVRLYRSFIVAETYVSGKLEEASGAGFRRLAGYIFGNNRKAGSADGEKIAMTAPVTAEAVSEKIAMTAPVTMEAQGARWRIHFVMPAQYSLETLPRPADPEVGLRQIPPARFAVVRFNGLADADLFEKNARLLHDWAIGQGLRPAGAPQLARYNPPWTPSILRRNEVLLPIE